MFYHKNFSRGCAPHPLSLKTRFSLYHIKVLHLFANRLLSSAGNSAGWRAVKARRVRTRLEREGRRQVFANRHFVFADLHFEIFT